MSEKLKKVKLRKIIALTLAICMCFTLIPSHTTNAGSADLDELNNTKDQIIKSAAEYLESVQDPSGSIGSGVLVNDTAEAMKAIILAGKPVNAAGTTWLQGHGYAANNDTLARYISATKDVAALKELVKQQNDDGGFGLNSRYSSDMLDSILVLDAINMCNDQAFKEIGTSLCVYIAGHAMSDGTFSLNGSSDRDDYLTAMAISTVSKFLTDNILVSAQIDQIFDMGLSHLTKKDYYDFSKENIEHSLITCLALKDMLELENEKGIVASLKAVQDANGSFYNDTHLTSLAIELLSRFQFTNNARIIAFQTQLSQEEVYFEGNTDIDVYYALAYYTEYDAEYAIRTVVTNGNTVLYDNKEDVNLPADKTLIDGIAYTFNLNEMKDDGIVVTVQLLDDDTVIKETKHTIVLVDRPFSGSTEISAYNVSMDRGSCYVGEKVEVHIDNEILYATNVVNTMKSIITVYKGEAAMKSQTYDIDLLPELNNVKTETFTFEPDTLVPGEYDIVIQYLYQDKSIGEVKGKFSVLARPEEKIDEETNLPVPTTTIDLFSAYLNSYVMFTGVDNKLEIGAGLTYFTNQTKTYKLVIGLYDGDTLLTENYKDVTIDGSASYKEVKNVVNTVVKETSEKELTVKAVLYDGDTVVKETSEKVVVKSRPHQDLILNCDDVDGEKSALKLTWNDISDDYGKYEYRLYRRTEDGEFESKSIWNGSSKVKVLNIYPYYYGNQLANWMNNTISSTATPAGMGLFDIDAVYIDDFNKDPDKYLKDESGAFKYDVLMFGTWDSNNFKDLNEQSYNATQAFVDSGRGVLFGHDTVCRRGDQNHPWFAKFDTQLGLKVIPEPSGYSLNPSSRVKIVNNGFLTSYPWKLTGVLNIPSAHTLCQYCGNEEYDATVWIEFTDRTHNYIPSEGLTDSAYLVTKNQLALTQTGHSSAQATDDERKIIANTLFYLNQVSTITNSKDGTFNDLAAPDSATVVVKAEDNDTSFKMTATVAAKDNGTKYQYYVSAVPSTDSSAPSQVSNVITKIALSGVKGYVYQVDDVATNEASLITYDPTNEIVQNVILSDKDGNLSIDLGEIGKTEQKYLHIFTIDNENNVSDEVIIDLSNDYSVVDYEAIIPEITTDKEVYEAGDDITYSFTAKTKAFKVKADAKLEILDDEGNVIDSYDVADDIWLNSEDLYSDTIDSIIPDMIAGKYTAKITWYVEGLPVASASADYRVAENGELDNTVTTDKTSYMNTEIIALNNVITNSSTNAIEADVSLSIQILDSANNEVREFLDDIEEITQNSSSIYGNTIKASEIGGGTFTVVSKAVDSEGKEYISKTKFTVSEPAVIEEKYVGEIRINEVDGTHQKIDFNVTNQGLKDGENVKVIVTIYDGSTFNVVTTIEKTVTIRAGETLTFSETIDTTGYEVDNYAGVLSIVVDGENKPLDDDGFIIKEKTAPDTSETTTEVTTEGTTAATEEITAPPAEVSTTEAPPETNVKTGDSIMIYVAMGLLVMSAIALVVVYRKRGKENEE